MARSFTNRNQPEPFELDNQEWHLNAKVDLEAIAGALTGIHQFAKETGGQLTAEAVVQMRTAFAEVFAVLLVPSEVEEFVAGIHSKRFDLITELKPAMEWAAEELGKRLGRSASGFALGGQPNVVS